MASRFGLVYALEHNELIVNLLLGPSNLNPMVFNILCTPTYYATLQFT